MANRRIKTMNSAAGGSSVVHYRHHSILVLQTSHLQAQGSSKAYSLVPTLGLNGFNSNDAPHGEGLFPPDLDMQPIRQVPSIWARIPG
jgi:hypothetical protein